MPDTQNRIENRNTDPSHPLHQLGQGISRAQTFPPVH
jgi:hypothetical protein